MTKEIFSGVRYGQEVNEVGKTKKSAIKAALLEQLERRGAVGENYTDLVKDYMSLYDTKTGLIRDIEKRGVKVEVTTANGTVNIKTNDSVTDLLKVNAQMLKIADALGLDPAKAGAVPAGDEKL